jgi:hypothetical protein
VPLTPTLSSCHGPQGLNPIWQLNQNQHLTRTQWLPSSYYTKHTDGEVTVTLGNATWVPGAALRDDFFRYSSLNAHIDDFIASVANGTYLVPDLPASWFISEYVANKNLTGHALDDFYLYEVVYETLDDALTLDMVGLANGFTHLYGLDKENMVAEPGYLAIVDYLAVRALELYRMSFCAACFTHAFSCFPPTFSLFTRHHVSQHRLHGRLRCPHLRCDSTPLWPTWHSVMMASPSPHARGM